MSRRTLKYFLALFLPSVLALLLLVAGSLVLDADTKLAILKDKELSQADLVAATIAHDFEPVTSDLLMLSNDQTLGAFLNTSSDANRKQVENTFLNLSRSKRLYDQVRYLDGAGMEIVRVDFKNGVPAVVPREELQNKSGRYFFRDSINLMRSEIYVSPLDLNIEHNQIEMPIKPMIRFGAVVFDDGGRRRGVVLLNYFGDKLLQHFKKLARNHPESGAMLVNRDGFWLSSPAAQDEWGFMFQNNRSYSRRYPAEWNEISTKERGVLVTANGMFTFVTTYPLLSGHLSSTGTALPVGNSEAQLFPKQYYWKTVLHVPKARLPSASLGQHPVAAGMLMLALVLLGVASGAIGHYWSSREEARESLAESQARLQEVTDTLGEGVYVIDDKGQISFANPEAERMLGWPHEALLGRNVHELFHYKHADGTPCTQENCEIAKVIASGCSYRSDEQLFWRKDGSSFPIQVSSMPIHRNGKIAGSVVAFSDITERKRIESSLRQSKEQIEAILNATTESMFLLDLQGKVLAANPTGAHRLGKQPADLVGKCVFDLLPPEVAAKRRNMLEEVCESGQAKRLDDSRDGRFYETYFYPVLDVEGRTASLVAFAIDVTTRKQAEESLRALNETLEERVQEQVAKNLGQEKMLIQQSRLAAMGEMIGNIAHQWRQPLNALSLLFANIKDEYEFNELTPEALEKDIRAGHDLVKKMSTTIDDFRNFFNPNKEKTNFSIRKIVADAVNLIGSSLKSQGIVIEIESDSELEVTGYPNELSQVLLNVISNARDAFLENEMGRGSILISWGVEGGRAILTVRDNAGGIPEDVLTRIFDAYFTTKEKGTGIGLYMSRTIMEHMNGRIEARNVEGGAEFTVVCSLPSSNATVA